MDVNTAPKGCIENPHLQQQKDLIDRISNSALRLNEILDNINKELKNLEVYKERVNYVNSVWTGYNKKLNICFENLANSE